MTQVNPTIKYYAYLNAAWVELAWSSDTVRVQQGIMDNDPASRIASVGELNFTLNNDGDIYTPGHTSAISGWKNGVKIKQVITYDSVDYPSIWHIEPRKGIQIDARTYGTRKATVKALDWLDYAQKQPIGNATIETDVTADDVITTLLAGMPIAPINTSLDVGANTFTTALDTSTNDASVYSELAKLALSEWGYIYVRPDNTDGETLHFENYYHRSGLTEETVYDTDQVFDDTVIPFDAEVVNGENVINSVKVYAYPRKLDTSTVVLFTLSEPLQIASGQTITINGSYVNPTGGARANGFDMITPAATTDYLANDAKAGTGTNRTANVSVSASYGSNGFSHTVTNNYTANVWLTKFNCRGKGIYVENAISYEAEDTESISSIGTIQETIYQKYQKTLDFPETIAESTLFFDKDPETRINNITFYANRSDESMQAFLNLGIGDMIRIESTKGGIDALHFIQGVRYQITEGRIIMVTWITKQILNLAVGLSLLGCCFNNVNSNGMIDYGTIPQITNIDDISVSVWIYVTEPNESVSFAIISYFSDESGWEFYAADTRHIGVYSKWTNNADIWYTDDDVYIEDEWTHVVLTRDRRLVDNVPKIYVNGTEMTVTDSGAVVTGTLNDETGNHLMIGNLKTADRDYDRPFYGSIMGPRIYDTILDQTAITALYNAGRTDTDTETDNLVWQGGCFKSKDVSLYDGTKILDDDNRTIENIYGVTGRGYGLPLPFVTTPPSNVVKSLLHFNGTDGSTTFTDETGRIWTATGNAQIDTALKQFGTGSGLFDGAANSWITTPDHPSFNLADNDWTFDFWINFSDVDNPLYPAIFSQLEDVNNYFQIYFIPSSNIIGVQQNESGSYVWHFWSGFNPTVSTWYHVAIERYGNTPLIFIDGVSQAVTEDTTITGKTASALDGSVVIGAINAGNMIKASIDEFRFTNGTAQWTANFTPPTSEYT